MKLFGCIEGLSAFSKCHVEIQIREQAGDGEYEKVSTQHVQQW